MLVYDAVNIDIAHIADIRKHLFHWEKNEARQLAVFHISKDCTLLTSGYALLVVHQLLELPVLTEAFIEATRAKPPTDSHLSATDEFLQDEGRFLRGDTLPPFQHVHHVRRALAAVAQSLVRISIRLGHIPASGLLDVRYRLVIVGERLTRGNFYPCLAHDGHALAPDQLSVGGVPVG